MCLRVTDDGALEAPDGTKLMEITPEERRKFGWKHVAFPVSYKVCRAAVELLQRDLDTLLYPHHIAWTDLQVQGSSWISGPDTELPTWKKFTDAVEHAIEQNSEDLRAIESLCMTPPGVQWDNDTVISMLARLPHQLLRLHGCRLPITPDGVWTNESFAEIADTAFLAWLHGLRSVLVDILTTRNETRAILTQQAVRRILLHTHEMRAQVPESFLSHELYETLGF